MTIFPDLDGLGRSLSTMLQTESAELTIEFRKAVLPDELGDLIAFDRRIFGSFPDDLFEPEDWNSFESYWMSVNEAKVGCAVFGLGVDYDERPRNGCLYLASTGVLPEFQGKGLGRKQKEWQINYARQHGFSVIATNMRQSNMRVIFLNLSLGFKFRGLDATYYHDPEEPAVLMELSLTAG